MFKKYGHIAFFAFGFLFDVLTLGQIDNFWNLSQHFVVICLLSVFLLAEVFFIFDKKFLHAVFSKDNVKFFWPKAIHFLLGILYSAYFIFFFKSSGDLSHYIFLLVMVFLLIVNEFDLLGREGFLFRFVLWVVAVHCFFYYAVPIFMGKTGDWPFLISTFLSFCFFVLLVRALDFFKIAKNFIFSKIILPSLLVELCFMFAYFFNGIPPLPFVTTHLGLYQRIKVSKVDGQKNYQLDFRKKSWEFWKKSATEISVQDDQLVVFFQLYMPENFKQKVIVEWSQLQNRDRKFVWVVQDKIPLDAVGGREKGYRAYTVKKNYSIGRWRIRIRLPDSKVLKEKIFDISDKNLSESQQVSANY